MGVSRGGRRGERGSRMSKEEDEEQPSPAELTACVRTATQEEKRRASRPAKAMNQ